MINDIATASTTTKLLHTKQIYNKIRKTCNTKCNIQMMREKEREQQQRTTNFRITHLTKRTQAQRVAFKAEKYHFVSLHSDLLRSGCACVFD